MREESQKIAAGFAGKETQRGQLSRGASDVLAERDHHLSLGFNARHDDEANSRGELASAAACYIAGSTRSPRLAWPWDMHWWRPRGARENLVRAAALIIAEIERLDRAKLRAHARRLHDEQVQIGAQLSAHRAAIATAASRSPLDQAQQLLGGILEDVRVLVGHIDRPRGPGSRPGCDHCTCPPGACHADPAEGRQ